MSELIKAIALLCQVSFGASVPPIAGYFSGFGGQLDLLVSRQRECQVYLAKCITDKINKRGFVDSYDITALKCLGERK